MKLYGHETSRTRDSVMLSIIIFAEGTAYPDAFSKTVHMVEEEVLKNGKTWKIKSF